MQLRISIIKDPGGKVIVGFTLGTKTCALACIVLTPQPFYFLLLKCNLLRAVHEVSWWRLVKEYARSGVGWNKSVRVCMCVCARACKPERERESSQLHLELHEVSERTVKSISMSFGESWVWWRWRWRRFLSGRSVKHQNVKMILPLVFIFSLQMVFFLLSSFSSFLSFNHSISFFILGSTAMLCWLQIFWKEKKIPKCEV